MRGGVKMRLFKKKETKGYGINSFSNWNNEINILTIDECIKRNDTVDSIVFTIANQSSKFKLLHVREGDEVSNRYDIKKILERPNPKMNTGDFLKKMISQRELYNNAFCEVIRNNKGYIESLEVIEFDSCEVIKDLNDTYVIFMRRGAKKIINYKNLIHLRKKFSENDFFGNHSLSQLSNLLNVFDSLDNAVSDYLVNVNKINWVLKLGSNLRQDDIDGQVERFKNGYLKKNNGGIIVSDDRCEVEQLKTQTYQMDENIYKNIEKRLYEYFNINGNILTSDYTEMQYNAFYESVLEPILTQLTQELTSKLFTDTEKIRGNKIIVNANALQFANLDKRNAIAKTLTQMSDTITINEVRKLFYLPKIEDGEKFANRGDRYINDDEDKGGEE